MTMCNVEFVSLPFCDIRFNIIRRVTVKTTSCVSELRDVHDASIVYEQRNDVYNEYYICIYTTYKRHCVRIIRSRGTRTSSVLPMVRQNGPRITAVKEIHFFKN